MRPQRFARGKHGFCLGALVIVLAGCATVNRNVTVWRADDPGGIYPVGPMSGDPAYFVGLRISR